MTALPPDHPPSTLEPLPGAGKVRVWSPLAVGVYSLVLAYPGALLLAVKNWRALGMYKEAGRHVLGGILFSLPFIGIILFSSARAGRVFGLVINICAFSYLKSKLRSDIASATAEDPLLAVEYRPWYSALGWAVLGVLLLTILMVIVAFTLEMFGIAIPE